MLNPSAWGLGGAPFFCVCRDPATLASISAAMATAAEALPAFETVANIATVAGTALGAAGTIAAGRAQKDAAEFQAKQLEMKGKEEQAAAQREAEQYRRQRALALSQLTSKAAASGFTATDPSALAIQDEIARYGTIQEQMAQYGGKARRAGLEDQARAARFEGSALKRASYYDAGSTILGGISTLADRYNPRRQASSVVNTYYYATPPATTKGWQATVNYG